METNKPVHKITSGSVTAAIWKNTTKRGPMLVATFDRTYSGSDGPKRTTSYACRDLDSLVTAALQAQLWMDRQPSAQEDPIGSLVGDIPDKTEG